ncbi:MAG: hypothetical protein LBI19_02285 [Oscillospiraceae bacterium]|jgi:hypothetical protein|nr:hypothetical protein [Oscillospiraceae bacterium]
MNIASVGAASATATQQMQAKEPQIAQITAAPEHGRIGDTVEISPSRANRSAMQQNNMVKTVSMQAQMLSRMAERIIKEQYAKGNQLYMLLYGSTAVRLDPTLRPESFIPDFVPQEQHQAVANAIEYFSPVQTSRRIVEVAEDIAGGPEAIGRQPVLADAFRTAVSVAFNNVQDAVGGNLPELTQQTYEVTMQKFDNFTTDARTGEL